MVLCRELAPDLNFCYFLTSFIKSKSKISQNILQKSITFKTDFYFFGRVKSRVRRSRSFCTPNFLSGASRKGLNFLIPFNQNLFFSDHLRRKWLRSEGLINGEGMSKQKSFQRFHLKEWYFYNKLEWGSFSLICFHFKQNYFWKRKN